MTKQRDDLLAILSKAYEFYGKTPSTTHTQIWLDALRDYPPQLVADAFRRYYATGQYMPRPVQILQLLDDLKARKRASDPLSAEEGQRTPEVAQAWITYIRFAHGFELPASKSVPDMPISQALEIVNREAARQGMPEAIKPEHHIDSYWGTAAA
jgi:hypothetical protein